MSPDNPLGKYLPVHFTIRSDSMSVRWLEIGSAPLSDPFFFQTLQRSRNVEQRPEWDSDIKLLVAAAASLPAIVPTGFIFHLSRCGSTLLANVLRTAQQTVVLSEARPIQKLLQRRVFGNSPFPVEEWVAMRRMLLDSVVTLYGNTLCGPQANVVIKGNGLDLLDISLVRSVWPGVPAVVLIRDPVEIMVSVAKKGAGWVALRKSSRVAAETFGWGEGEVLAMTQEEYCARALGRFCGAAFEAIDSSCRVLDYTSLNVNTIYQIAEFFGLQLPPRTSPVITEALETYSKDPVGSCRFVADGQEKQRDATAAIRDAAHTFAEEPYTALRRLQVWT